MAEELNATESILPGTKLHKVFKYGPAITI